MPSPSCRRTSASQQHFAACRFEQYNGVRTPWVLHQVGSRCHREARARIGSPHSGFQSAAKRAKLPAGLHQHDLRHKRVTDWLAAGKSPVAVMREIAHSDIQTTMGYYRFVPDRLRALVTEDPPSVERPVEAVREVARA
jgi:integrase